MSERGVDMPRTEEEWRTYVANELRLGDRRMDELHDRIRNLEEQQASLQASVREAAASVHGLNGSIKEMLDVFASWKGAMKTLEMLGRVARPMAWIIGLGTSAVALYTAIRAGVGPQDITPK